ncbi:MAG: hypothetical protein KGL39_54540, partial [Patescibacteria group bacterium]|nr:hypothetical protein [Patescibacteria group bacterium]
MKFSKTYKLPDLFTKQNAAEILSDEDRDAIAKKVVEGYKVDEESRSSWLKKMKDAIKLALQVKEHKTEPWPGCSNVKFPLLTTAALQFQSRAYPALVTKPDLVNCRVIADDPDGSLTAQAERKATFMSYQLLEEDENWEEDTDRMLLQLPIVGCMFRKTYFDPLTAKNCSELVLPDDFVVDYYTTSLSSSSRYTHILHPTKDDIEGYKLAEYWLDVELPEVSHDDDTLKSESLQDRGFEAPADSNYQQSSRKVLEQYCRFDLDDDGYSEPYIVTVDLESEKMLRFVPNFTPEHIVHTNQAAINDLKNQMLALVKMPLQGQTTVQQMEDKVTRQGFLRAMAGQLAELAKQGKIISIEPIQYFTKYPFIPSPDGGFYDIGFGILLAPINDAVDTLINQMIDAGTLGLSNVGFLASNARVRGGNLQFRPFELMRVEVPAGMLKDAILPLEVNPPPPILFQLLEMLIGEARQLSSATEVMTGQLPGQNTKATVATQALDQGMKVF